MAFAEKWALFTSVFRRMFTGNKAPVLASRSPVAESVPAVEHVPAVESVVEPVPAVEPVPVDLTDKVEVSESLYVFERFEVPEAVYAPDASDSIPTVVEVLPVITETVEPPESVEKAEESVITEVAVPETELPFTKVEPEPFAFPEFSEPVVEKKKKKNRKIDLN